ncbi:MAG: hypothetical protein H6588_08635 [Flavobacteriales bacterium]|nr:hypothetical protein [Flavobacteriales bacterium]
MIKKIYILSVIIFYNFSCKSDNNDGIVEKVKICMDARVNEEGLNIDLIEEYKKIEEDFIKQNLLKDKTKESYLKLFNKIQKGEIKYEYTMENKEWFYYPSVNKAPFSCVWFVLKDENMNNENSFFKKVSLFLEGDSFDNWDLNNSIITECPDEFFNSMYFRSTVLMISCLNLARNPSAP